MHVKITIIFHDWLQFESLMWFAEILMSSSMPELHFVSHFDLFYKANSLDKVRIYFLKGMTF